MKRRVTPIALLALAAACSSTRAPEEQEAAPSGRIVPASELPADYRRAAQSWKEDGEEWRAWRERALEDPALARFVVDNLIDVMVEAYTRSQLATAGDEAGPFERARRDLIYLKQSSMPVLVELVAVGDNVVAFLAGDTLARMDDAAVAPLAAELLQAPESETRRRAAELLARLPHALEREETVTTALERALLDDPEWSVRAQAALAVAERGRLARDATGPLRLLSLALADPDPAVVEAAARGLAELGDPRALPALVNVLERLARDSDRAKTIHAVQDALLRISGERAAKSPAEWRQWLRKRAGS